MCDNHSTEISKEVENNKRKYGSFKWEKISNIFSFIRIRRRNFYFFFIRILVVVWMKFPFLPIPQTCAHNVHLGFRVVLIPVVLMCHLVCAYWIDTTRRYYSCKGPSEPSPCVLMIVWTLGR